MIHLYVGDGKGKTTAAVGLAVRAVGAGRKVLFIQFLKNGTSSECAVLDKLDVSVLACESITKFVKDMSSYELELAEAECKANLKTALLEAERGYYDVIILDEILDTVPCGFLERDSILDLLRYAGFVEIVMTGHYNDTEFMRMADYFTTFNCMKHPYYRGVKDRKGIEY